MKPWVVYTRVSTEEQARGGLSLESQLAACTAIAKAHGYPIIHIEDAGFSAKDLDQPGAHKIRALAEDRKIAGVLVYKLDRIARHTRQLLELVEHLTAHDCDFTSVHERIDTSGASGRLILTVLAALAQFEREQLSERIKITNDHRRSEGAWIAGAPPIGLALEKRGKLRFLIPHPQWGPLIAKTWPMVIAGKSLAQICAYLTEHKVPTASARRSTGTIWAKNALSHLLLRTTAIGHLVDQKTYDQARVVLDARYRPGKAGTAADRGLQVHQSPRIWRLQGIARCAHCGAALTGAGANGRSGRYYYLRCTGKVHRGRAFCDATDLPAETWEDAVVRAVGAYIQDKKRLRKDLAKAVAARQADAGPAREEMNEVTRRRDLTQKRLERALEVSLEGGAVARAVGPKIGQLQEEIEHLSIRLATLEGRLAAVDITKAQLAVIAENIEIAAANLDQADWGQQAQVLKILVQSVSLGVGMPCKIQIDIPGEHQHVRTIPGRSSVLQDGRQWLTSGDQRRTAGIGSIDVEMPVKVRVGAHRRVTVEAGSAP